MPKRLVALLKFWTRPVEKWTMFPVLVGFLAYAYVTHFNGLNPFKVDWLLPFWRGTVDSSDHYIGWEFFRHTPLLQWPIGANYPLGMELSSSIVFTDSIPIAAYIAKLLNPILPTTFQYLGIWIWLCFALQAFFAQRFLKFFLSSVQF